MVHSCLREHSGCDDRVCQRDAERRLRDGFNYFADDVVGHVPGRSALAGVRHGREDVEAYIRAVIDSADGTIDLVLVDTLVGAEHVALMVIEKLGAGADAVEIHRTNVYRVRDDKIVEIRIFEGDQYLVDEYKTRKKMQ